MRNFELYPSTKAPLGKFVVIEYEIFSGVGHVIGVYAIRFDAEYKADAQNFHRHDTIDSYRIAYDSRGRIIRDSSVFFPKRPGIAL